MHLNSRLQYGNLPVLRSILISLKALIIKNESTTQTKNGHILS